MNRLRINPVFKRILALNLSSLDSSARRDESGAKIRLNNGFMSRRFIHLRRIIRL